MSPENWKSQKYFQPLLLTLRYDNMKNGLICFFILLHTLKGIGQKTGAPDQFIRLYEDNDGINAWGKGTDWGYTNGSRIDFFLHRKKSSSGLLARLFTAGKENEIRTTGWGLMQIMITPQKTRPSIPDRNDYPYAGALLALHTLHMAHSGGKLNLKREWVAGIMGPASFAKESQILLHRLIGDPRPNGWDYQLPTDLLLNYNLSIEKQCFNIKGIEFISGGQVAVGTMQSGVACFGIIRFQKNMASFAGLSSQYFSTQNQKLAFSVSVKPSAELSLYNALLDGGLFNRQSPVHDQSSKYGTDLHRRKVSASAEFIVHLSYKKMGASFNQKIISPDFKKYNSHQTGNLCIYIGW